MIVAARISHRDVRRQNEQEGCGSDRPEPSFLTTAVEKDPSCLNRARGIPTKQDLLGKSIVMSWSQPLFLGSGQVVWSLAEKKAFLYRTSTMSMADGRPPTICNKIPPSSKNDVGRKLSASPVSCGTRGREVGKWSPRDTLAGLVDG